MAQFCTPLRYPGGKQKLAPFVAEVLKANDLKGGDYVEPYSGGAGVACELLVKGLVKRIHLNDVSGPIAAFWRAVKFKNDQFCKCILNAALTVPEWRRHKEVLSRPLEFDDLELGFSFFFVNRCNRSGIPNAGLIGGLAQNGEWKMDARFPRAELVRRVQALGAKSEAITVHNCDAESFLASYLPTLPQRTLVYCDPPYFHKADRLYYNTYSPKDHLRLALFIQTRVKHPWLISYDNTPEIREIYKNRKSFNYSLQYNASTAYKGEEVFVFSDSLCVPTGSVIPAIDRALRSV